MRKMVCFLVLLGSVSFAAGNAAELKRNDSAAVSLREPATLTAPKGPRGWYWHGLVLKHDSVWNLRDDVYALRFEARNIGKTPFNGTATLFLAEGQGRRDRLERSSASFRIPPSGEWQTIELPIASFDYARGEEYFLKFISRITLSGTGGETEVRNFRFIEAPLVKVSAPVRSKAAENGVAEYEFTVKNVTSHPQILRLTIPKRGWEGMTAGLSHEILELASGKSASVKLTVKVPAKLPPGAHETTTVTIASASPGFAPATLEFITVQRVPSPFLLRDAAGWREVADNVRKYDWAKREFEKLKKLADSWTPPAKSGVMSDQGTMGVVRTRYEHKLRACLILYQLIGKEEYFRKIRDFLLMFSNPRDGYPVLLHATSQGIPQEGGTFELVAQGYDIIRERLSPAERNQVEDTMRLYVDTIIDRMGDGGITNWTIFNQVPAAACALILHDMVRFHTLVYAPTGLIDQFVCGTMSDGWWFEMSVTYNLHCAEKFTQLALYARPFGIDFLNMRFPIALSELSGRRPFELSNYQGMAFTKYGPIRRNNLGFKAMWDAILSYPDYRGIMVGMGDGHEVVVAGNFFEIAYFAFRDPRYASILKTASERDLVYAVGNLPEKTPILYRSSAHSDNAGIALLRSQSGSDREQIQLGFKYGTHGGYHGHFDRLSLLSLMRYGRGFWNPESVWYGYPSYLYKFWVQTSLPHNMVVVDGKMQEPAECRPLLFHSGPHLQVSAADGSARWSNPPYLGGYDKIRGVREGMERYLPIPEDHPAIGAVTDYTEPVFSRRLQLVTDDYVLIADYLKSDRVHTFDNLLHLRGAKPLSGLKQTGHRAQFDSSPLSSGQFVVNVSEYEMSAPAKLTSLHRFHPKKADGRNRRASLELTDDYYHEPGELLIDVWHVWPRTAQVLIGDYPENQLVGKRLTYRVLGDGRTLASGRFHAWILGKGVIDADVSGIRTLTLEMKKDHFKRGTADTLFWADAILKTADGKTIPLSSLKPVSSNLKKQPAPGKDYCGGPVRISGSPYTDTIGAEPADAARPGTRTYDLSGLNAVRFTAFAGGDFPAGQEENLRKFTSLRSIGTEAKFLSVLEPREGKNRVQSVRALNENTVEVTLVDGTVDLLTLRNFYDTSAKPSVELRRNGTVLEKTE